LGRNLLSSAWLGSPNGSAPDGVPTLLPGFSTRKHFYMPLIAKENIGMTARLMNISPRQSIQ
jgi:hypothetical protein